MAANSTNDQQLPWGGRCTGPAGPHRVLWVTDQAPDRSAGGGSIRQAHLFEALARVHSVDLLVAGSLSDEHVRATAATVIEVPKPPAIWSDRVILRRALLLAITLGSRYSLTGYLSRPGRRELTRALRGGLGAQEGLDRYDLVCVEHEGLAPVIPGARTQPWVITFHNLLSGMLESEVGLAERRSSRWFRRREVGKARRLEERAAESYDHCITCSDGDAAALAGVGGPRAAGRISVIPNGVDLEEFRALPVPKEPRVLFPGTLSYAPNVDGAVWFCSEIWPRVREAVPQATLTLAGRRPAPAVAALAGIPGVEVHADVPSIVPYFEAARAVVVPLRVGTGTSAPRRSRRWPLAGPSLGPRLGSRDWGSRTGSRPGSPMIRRRWPPLSWRSCAGMRRRPPSAEPDGATWRRISSWARIGSRFLELVGRLLERPAARPMAAAGR